MMVVEPKTAQPVESDEEPVDLFISTSWRVQKFQLSSKTLVQLVEVQSRSNGYLPNIKW